MDLIRPFVFTNRFLIRLFCVVLVSLLLNGCAAVASIPVPLRIASNIHTGYTLYKNLDDNPENDSWYVSYIKSLFAKDKEEDVTLYTIADKGETVILNSNPLPKIKL